MQVIDCELTAVVQAFRDAMAGAGLTPPDVIHADGQAQRCGGMVLPAW